MSSMRQHGPWRIKTSRTAYEDPWMRVVRDEVIRPDGQDGSYAVVHLKPGVSVLAMDDEDNVYLTEEFHYAVGRRTLEVVSGGIEPGEDALLTAQRELDEELGITARQWSHLGTVEPFTASVLSPTELFLARDITLGEPSPDGAEVIELLKMPLAEAIQRVSDGTITHSVSCVLLLKVWMMWQEGG